MYLLFRCSPNNLKSITTAWIFKYQIEIKIRVVSKMNYNLSDNLWEQAIVPFSPIFTSNKTLIIICCLYPITFLLFKAQPFWTIFLSSVQIFLSFLNVLFYLFNINTNTNITYKIVWCSYTIKQSRRLSELESQDKDIHKRLRSKNKEGMSYPAKMWTLVPWTQHISNQCAIMLPLTSFLYGFCSSTWKLV